MITIVTCEFQDLTGLLRTAKSLDALRGTFVWIIVSSRSVFPKEILSFNPLIVKDGNLGVYSAMNIGLDVPSSWGNFVYFLNSGDEVMPEAFVIASNQLESSYDAYIFSVSVHELTGDFVRLTSTNPTDVAKMLCGGRGFLLQGMFLNYSLFSKYGHFDTSFKVAGDLDFMARFIKGSKVVGNNLVISKFYLGGISSRLGIVNARELRRIRAREGVNYLTSDTRELAFGLISFELRPAD